MPHVESAFTGKDNLNLFYQGWLPDSPPGSILLVVHGLAEHSGRYAQFADYFTRKGYAVYALDLRGHGKSEGQRCDIKHFSDYVDDLISFHSIIQSKHPDTPIFIVGHSMGGTIATAYGVLHQEHLPGLILSAPVFKPGTSITPLQIRMAKILSVVMPKMGVAVIDASTISRDGAVVDAYVNDPLVFRGKICARMGMELFNVIQMLPPAFPGIKLPVLVMYGTNDRLSNPEGATLFYDRVGSVDKTLKRYEGFYHEIFNEPGHEKVFADIAEWLRKHS